MKFSNIYNKVILAALMVMGMASCADENLWEAGPETVTGCQQVYFPADNETTVFLNAQDGQDRVAEFIIKRDKAEGAIQVPVEVVSAADGLSFPATVSFGAGETEAVVSVSAPVAVQEGTSYDFQIKVTGEHVDPYTDLGGSSMFSGSITFPKIRTAKCYFGNMTDRLGYWKETVFDCGNGRYYIPDLMHSGRDLNFQANLKAGETYTTDITLGSKAFVGDAVEPDTDYPGCTYYYFYDYEKGAWDKFYPRGEQDKNGYVYGLTLYTGDGWAAFSDPSQNWSYDLVVGVTEVDYMFYEKDYSKYWTYLYMKFVDEATDETDYSLPAAPKEEEEGEWNTANAYFYYNSYTGDGISSFKVQWKVDEETGTYTLHNFLNSGYDVYVKDNGDWTVDISCSDPDTGYAYDNVFYFYDWGKDDYVPFYPNGTDGPYMNFSFDLTSVYNYVDTEYGELWLTLTDVSVNGTSSKADYLVIEIQ